MYVLFDGGWIELIDVGFWGSSPYPNNNGLVRLSSGETNPTGNEWIRNATAYAHHDVEIGGGDLTYRQGALIFWTTGYSRLSNLCRR